MHTGIFVPHGQFGIHWYGDVLYSQWSGTFNAEAMRAYLDALKAAIAHRQPPVWGRIVDLRIWEGMTPEAAQGFEELAQWLKTTRCVASAQVFSNEFFQRVAGKVADDVAKSHNLIQVLTMAEARAFISSFGVTISPDLPA